MKQTLKEGIERNQSRQCKVANCYVPRINISSFCYTHTEANKRHGHPLGRLIKPVDYALELERVADIIARNSENHAGITDALAKCDFVIYQGRQGRGDIPGLKWIHQAVTQTDLTPTDLLTMIAALCLLHKYTDSPIRNEKSLHMATAWQLFRLGKVEPIKLYGKTIYKTHTPKIRRECGEYLFRLVGIMAYNLSDKAYGEMVTEQHASVLQSQELA